MGTITKLSPITGKLTTYYEHSTLATYTPGNPVSTESLKTLMNSDISTNGYDAFVDEVKVFQEPFFNSVQTHLWISGSSPVDPIIGLAILALIVSAVVAFAIWEIKSSAQSIVEHFWPQAKFYQVDVNGTQIVVNSQAEYITCQRAANPSKFVCGYCGQVFNTEDEKTAHEANCPWTSGVPGQAPSWMGLAILGIGAVLVLGGIWVVAKIFGGDRKTPIIVTR